MDLFLFIGSSRMFRISLVSSSLFNPLITSRERSILSTVRVSSFFFFDEMFYSIQVKNFLSSANKISTQGLTIVERSEVYFYFFFREMMQLEMIEFHIMP